MLSPGNMFKVVWLHNKPVPRTTDGCRGSLKKNVHRQVLTKHRTFAMKKDRKLFPVYGVWSVAHENGTD
jgi:hypothetical protein